MLRNPYIHTTALIAASIGFSLFFACATPMVALAVYAALTMSPRHAMATTLGIWFANQLVGYGLLDYPQTADSFMWGAALGLLAAAALVTAQQVVARAGRSLQAIGIAFAASFIAYQGAMYVVAMFIGGLESMAPSIIAWAGMVNLAAFIGFYGSHVMAEKALASAQA